MLFVPFRWQSDTIFLSVFLLLIPCISPPFYHTWVLPFTASISSPRTLLYIIHFRLQHPLVSRSSPLKCFSPQLCPFLSMCVVSDDHSLYLLSFKKLISCGIHSSHIYSLLHLHSAQRTRSWYMEQEMQFMSNVTLCMNEKWNRNKTDDSCLLNENYSSYGISGTLKRH